MKLAIYGAGGLGLEYLELALENNRWEKIIIVDDIKKETVLGYDPISFQEFEKKYTTDNVEFIIAQGEPRNKKDLYYKIKNRGYKLTNLIDKNAYVSRYCDLGEGIIIKRGVNISAGVVIKDNVCIHANSNIGHHTLINSHCQIGALVTISGNCIIEDECFIGAGASIKERIVIEQSSIISLGAVILKNVTADSIMIGNPARLIAKNENKNVFK